MSQRKISLLLSLVFAVSIATTGCGSRLDAQNSIDPSQVSAMSVDDGTDPAQVAEVVSPDDIVFDNQTSTTFNDYIPDEIVDLTHTNDFPFLDDLTTSKISTTDVYQVSTTATTTTATGLSTQSLASIGKAIVSVVTFQWLRNKITAWRQASAAKKLAKYQNFEEQNPALAKELGDAAQLKGSAKRAKLKELKAKYPTSFNAFTKKIAANRWVKFESKNASLASDLMDFSTLPNEQKAERMTELKAKYPNFFHTSSASLAVR